MAGRVTLRLDFDADRRVGPGKIALLEAIRRCGSISAAGREFGMSYRRAWLLVDEMNRMFRDPVVVTKGGGRNGGGASLTACGEALVRSYRDAEHRAETSARPALDWIEGSLASVTAD